MHHFALLFRELDKMDREPTRTLLSIPPQFGKSTVAFHVIARAMLAGRSIIYATYSHDFAMFQARRAKRVAEKAGVEFRSDSRAITEWYGENGSVFTAVGIGGSVTGKPSDLILIDDPIKGYAEAASRAYRDAAEDWFRSSVLTRANPRTSIVVIHTRFHPNDLIGTLSKEPQWTTINLPAIGDDGQSLWPEERPLEFLEAQRKQLGEFAFAALYQGAPRPRGQEVFGPPTLYDAHDLPTVGYQQSIGVDFAYTAKTHSDSSVAVVMARQNNKLFVLDMVRKQCPAPEFAMHLRGLQARYPQAATAAYIGGTEQGTIDFFHRSNIPVKAFPARGDKFTRAQLFAAAWNRGDVLVPASSAPWLPAFLDEISSFTGVNDRHDDIVDAACVAFDTLANTSENAERVDVVKKTLAGSMRRHW